MARILTMDNVKEQLKKYNTDYEGRRTWSQLYGSIDLSAQQALEQSKYDYSSAINDAYIAANKEKSLIASSTLGQGYKQEALADIDFSLNEAFNTYRTNYLSQVSQIESNAAQAASGIDALLEKQAENVKLYQEMPYQYLSNLYERAYGSDQYEADKKLSSLFEGNANWSKYVVNDEVNGGKRLLTEEELYDSLYDSAGNLTIKGADFYDQMLNELGTLYGESYGFYSWLANENKDLYEWSQSYNPYSYGPDMLGNNVNASSIKTMFGLASNDETYKFAERLGGMNEGELTAMMDKYVQSVTDLYNKVNDTSGRKSRNITGEVNNMVSEVKLFAEQLGIEDDLEKEMGMTFDDMSALISNKYAQSRGNGQLWAEGVTKVILGTATATAAGAGIGSSAGAPGTAAGAIVAGGASLIYLTFAQIAESISKAKNNKQLAEESARLYSQLVSAMTNYAQNKRRTLEIEQNKKY